MIQLKEITKENYRACMNLKTTKEQEDFVAPNCYSMLEAIYEEPRQAFALYNGEEMVGFILFSFYETIQKKQRIPLRTSAFDLILLL